MKVLRVILLVLAFCFPGLAQASSMYFLSSDLKYEKVVEAGEIFTVDAWVFNTWGRYPYYVDFDTIRAWIAYDPTYLEVQDADPATPGIQIQSDPNGAFGFNNHIANNVDAAQGKIDLQESWLNGGYFGGRSMAAPYARITFKALQPVGQVDLVYMFNNPWDYTPTTALLRNGKDVLGSETDHSDGAGVFSIGITPKSAWREDFNPIKSTWRSEATNPGFGCIITDLGDGKAKVSEAGNTYYGKVLSEVLTLDVSAYPIIEIVSTAVDSDSSYGVRIQEEVYPYNLYDVTLAQGAAGTCIGNIAQATGWSGTHTFSIEIWISGDNKSSTFDLIKIREDSNIGWADDFIPKKSSWRDNTTNPGFDCNIGSSGGYAMVVEVGPNTWGKVASEVISLDIDTYPIVEVKALEVAAGSGFKIGIQEEEGSYAYRDMIYQTSSGVSTANVANTMGWTGKHTFSVVVIIEGDNKYTTFDYIRIRKPAIWSEDFSNVSDWAVGYDPSGGSAITSDGNLGLLYVNGANTEAAFIPATSIKPFAAFDPAKKNQYTLNFTINSLTSSTSYDVGLDLFDANRVYIATVWNVFPASGTTTAIGPQVINLGGFTYNANTAYLMPKINVHTGDGAQTVKIDNLNFSYE